MSHIIVKTIIPKFAIFSDKYLQFNHIFIQHFFYQFFLEKSFLSVSVNWTFINIHISWDFLPETVSFLIINGFIKFAFITLGHDFTIKLFLLDHSYFF